MESKTETFEEEKISILIVDDHPLVRKALRDLLDKENDFQIVDEAGDGDEAVAMANKLVPDVIIMDLGMPRLNGIEAIKQIKQLHPDIAILVLTVHDDSEHILEVLQAGASGYLIKSVFEDEVVNAVRGVYSGDSVLSPQILQKLIKYAIRYPSRPVSLGNFEKLSTREIDILKLAATGLSNKDIAVELGLSIRTIKGYLADIYSKLAVTSRTEAVIVGFRSGLLNIDDLQ